MKSKPRTHTVDAYIAEFPPELQELLQKIRGIVRAAAPGAIETIKYQIPTFVLGDNLVHFAAHQRHIGFYPTPSCILAFQKELAGYRQAKGSVQFPLDAPIPYGLIKRMVQHRVREVRLRSQPRLRSNSKRT